MEGGAGRHGRVLSGRSGLKTCPNLLFSTGGQYIGFDMSSRRFNGPIYRVLVSILNWCRRYLRSSYRRWFSVVVILVLLSLPTPLTTLLPGSASARRHTLTFLHRLRVMEWFGRAKVKFTTSTSPLVIQERDGTQTDLLKICEKITPPCQLNPLLFNGHIQTMWTAIKQHGPPIYYKRRVFEAEHKTYEGTFAVDFVSKPFTDTDATLPPRTAYFRDDEFVKIGSDDSRPMLVVLHGLSGGSHEIYLRHAIAPLILEGGWEVCVVNSRGCAQSSITTGILYNGRATWDIRQTVKWLRATYPNRPLFGLGFSLGANMLTTYCGEEGSACLLKAAVICSNPFNLDVANRALQRTFLGKEVYQRVMGTSMKQLITGHEQAVKKYTKLDYDRIQKVTYLYEFDREVQCICWGYPTEDAYYRDASSSDSVLAIRIPFFALHATDDPIAVKEAVPFEEFKKNPCTVLCTTSLGGHLCWFEIGGGRWHARPVSNFLNHMAFKVDLDSISPEANGRVTDGSQLGAFFDPMRRKMEVVVE